MADSEQTPIDGVYEARLRAAKNAEREKCLRDFVSRKGFAASYADGEAANLVDAIRELALPAIEKLKRTEKQYSLSKPCETRGRKRIRPIAFENLAGRLWRQNQGERRRVSDESLQRVAIELDKSPFRNPCEYLVRYAADILKRRNDEGSFDRGPIVTWEALVDEHDELFLQAMRKLLSRCAEKMSANDFPEQKDVDNE